MGEYEMWSGDETGLGASRGCSGSFFFFFFPVMTGCWAAGSCFPVRSGSVAGHGQLRLWALCSLVEQHCSTGGDSQAYQVKKKCLATEGFSCWARVCVCVRVCGGGGGGRAKWDGIKGMELVNFNRKTSQHPRRRLKVILHQTFTNIHSAPVLCLFHKTCLDIFGSCPKFTDVLGLFYLACSSCDYLETWVLCLCMFVSVFPLTLHCAAAGPGPVPVDQVSLCLCLLL